MVSRRVPMNSVHPRWRGEHNTLQGIIRRGHGSSPLARGTHQRRRRQHRHHRFIPAGAGNTAMASSAAARVPVHPRWRGEHLEPASEPGASLGSSPLARGTPLGGDGTRIARRFIPAGAGNTPPAPGPTGAGSVHPRWRGEHLRSRIVAWLESGSSPLARGTPLVHLGEHVAVRFIPAGAGNTRCGAG